MADATTPPKATRITFDQALDTATLQGRSVLVTGGASGIGLACATKIAEIGALVTIADRNEEAGQAIVQDLVSKGHKAQFVQCDVTSYEAQAEMFKKAVLFGNGKIDVVIPSAGIVAEKNLFDMVPKETPSLDSPPPPEPGFSVVDVNLHAVYKTCFLAMHYFRLPRDQADTFKPNIVLIGSCASYIGYPNSSTYSIAKFGVRGLFYSIRERAPQFVPRVRVNLVAPWYIETAMTRRLASTKSVAGVLLSSTGFAPMDEVVNIVTRFSSDERLHGRAAAIFPHGNEDLGDDLEGAYAGQVLQPPMSKIAQKFAKGMAEWKAQAQAKAEAEARSVPKPSAL